MTIIYFNFEIFSFSLAYVDVASLQHPIHLYSAVNLMKHIGFNDRGLAGDMRTGIANCLHYLVLDTEANALGMLWALHRFYVCMYINSNSIEFLQYSGSRDFTPRLIHVILFLNQAGKL